MDEDSIPAASFAVDDVQAEFERLQALGVWFTRAPFEIGDVAVAVFDDRCGSLIQCGDRPDREHVTRRRQPFVLVRTARRSTTGMSTAVSGPSNVPSS